MDGLLFYRMGGVSSEGSDDGGEVSLLLFDFLVCERHGSTGTDRGTRGRRRGPCAAAARVHEIVLLMIHDH